MTLPDSIISTDAIIQRIKARMEVEAGVPGTVRIIGELGGFHPADGLTADVSMGGGAFMSMANPISFKNGGPEWICRYGNVEGIRYAVASLLASYDYLLSEEINMTEAVRRLRMMRAARAALISQTESSQ